MAHTARKSQGDLWQIVWGYIGLYTIVNIIALIFLFLVVAKRVCVFGYGPACKAVLRGNVIIASNHPSALETFVLPVLFWPMHLFVPRLFPWSIARYDAFPVGLRPLYSGFRCIQVGSPSYVKAAYKHMEKVLLHKGVLVAYPESTRTCKGVAHWRSGNRQLSVFRSALPHLAMKCNSVVVPVWIDFGEVRTPLSMRSCLWRVLFACPMRVFVGEPYCVDAQQKQDEQNAELVTRLLNA